MLTFVFALAAIWTLFWFIMLMLDRGDRTPFSDTKAICTQCAASISQGVSGKAANTQKTEHTANNAGSAATHSSPSVPTAPTVTSKPSDASAVSNNTTKSADCNGDSIKKQPVADKHDQANVTPLFVAPDEQDDLKVIKGIGVVMEKTLNDLGITTFKQLAGFKQADVKMVSDVLSESNAGFGDRIQRDEWVDQAKGLVQKAS